MSRLAKEYKPGDRVSWANGKFKGTVVGARYGMLSVHPDGTDGGTAFLVFSERAEYCGRIEYGPNGFRVTTMKGEIDR